MEELIESDAPPYVGHWSTEAMIKGLEAFFYWPTFKKGVDAFVHQCLVCQKVQYEKQNILQPLPFQIDLGRVLAWTLFSSSNRPKL